ncbi:MAG TPA: hypothetical protein VN969_46495 [Streptosporangiaceae bacterium]|nr:hypothetical protein [Streptosporangiaceae bacterium]
MRLLVIPPHGDLTLRAAAAGTCVAEPYRQFACNLAAGPGDRPDDTGDPWLAAARLAVSAGDPLLRLRALDVLLAARYRPGDGVRVSLGDLELVSGSTENLSDVQSAADAPAPYDRELAELADRAGGASSICLAIDRDQQLPAALGIASRLPRGTDLHVTGRFAAWHWDRLRAVPSLRVPARPDPAGLAWAVSPQWAPGGTAVAWRERAADPVPAGAWAGRVSLHDMTRLDQPGVAQSLERAVTVVLGVCGLAAGRFIGRGGTCVPAEGLIRSVQRLRDMGVQPLAEVWVGAPGVTAAQLRDCVSTLGADLRIAGFRLFDWPVSWRDPLWAGQAVTLGRRAHDLSRRHEIRSPAIPDAETRDALLSEVATPLQLKRDLVPARVAAAYLWRPRASGGRTGLMLDEDAVVIPHPGGGSRIAALSFRTGAAVVMPARLLPVLGGRPGCGPHPIAPEQGSGADRAADRLLARGILRWNP